MNDLEFTDVRTALSDHVRQPGFDSPHHRRTAKDFSVRCVTWAGVVGVIDADGRSGTGRGFMRG